MDCIVHGVTKGRTRLSDFDFDFQGTFQLLVVVVQLCLTFCDLAAHQASLSFTIPGSLLKLMSIESVMPSNHLILSSPSPPAFTLKLGLKKSFFVSNVSSKPNLRPLICRREEAEEALQS